MKTHTPGTVCPGCDKKMIDASPGARAMFYFVKEKHNDVHTSWVFRDEGDQNKFFSQGGSNARWPNSVHNKKPVRCFDMFQIDSNGHAIYDPKFCYQVEKELKEAGFEFINGRKFPGLGDYGHFQTKEKP